MVAKDIEKEIADIADRLSKVGKDKAALSKLSEDFQNILIDMFDELPQIVETEDSDDLEFKGGKLRYPVSNDTLSQIVDIHFFLWNADVPYDEFIFTNALGEIENRESAGDTVAHEIVARYDELDQKYNG
jgi:hypothetical protein